MAGFKTEPSLGRKISDINPNLDTRVRIIGNVVSSQEGLAIVDDGSGKINVAFSDETPMPLELSIGQIVRVIGFVIPSDPVEIQAEVINDMSKLNTKYIDILLK
jgi:uncharacterized protein YdeI (BOF family)